MQALQSQSFWYGGGGGGGGGGGKHVWTSYTGPVTENCWLGETGPRPHYLPLGTTKADNWLMQCSFRTFNGIASMNDEQTCFSSVQGFILTGGHAGRYHCQYH
jgi:hypothetical protein